MRPEIPSGLEQRVEQVYAEAGYATGSELVRDAVRRWLPQAEAFAEGKERTPRVEALLVFDFLDNDRPRERTPLTIDLRAGKEGYEIVPLSVEDEDGVKNRYDDDTQDEIVTQLSEGATARLYVNPNSTNQTEYSVVPEISWSTEELGGKWRIAKVHDIEIAEQTKQMTSTR